MKSRLLFIKLLALVACLLFSVTTTLAQSQEETQTRIRQLETQVEQMRAEIEALKQVVKTKETQNAETKSATVETSRKTETANKETPRQETVTTKPENRPGGIELGPVRVTPYGTIYFNAFGNSGGTNNADVPLFATPTGNGNFSASLRQTRLGLKIDGPKVWNAKSSGVIEADFFGGFPAVGVGENFGVVRLRLAYAKLDWEKSSLEAGQDWVIFAPVNPVSIAAAAIPQMAGAGNPWTRLPQIRYERRFDGGRVLLQGAIVSPSTGDFPGTNAAFFLQPGTGASSRLPAFESRISFGDKNWFGTKKQGGIGVSAHYGRARVANTLGNNKIDSFGVALDWSMPLHKRVSFAGEAFTGRNLAAFQSGVFQGFNSDFAYLRGTARVSGGPRAIGTRGGWTQLGWNVPAAKDRITIYGSIGIDDPRDEDLISLALRDWRKKNLAYSFSLHYKHSPQFIWALEFRRFETQHAQSGKQTANHLNLGVAYSF
jgi:hypothetical protein